MYACMYECKSVCMYDGWKIECMFASIYYHLNKLYFIYFNISTVNIIVVFALMTYLKGKLTNTFYFFSK